MGALFVVAAAFARPLAAAVTFPLEVKWSARLAAPPAFAPAYDAEHVYVSLRTDELVALLIRDGTRLWSVECPMTAPPAAGHGFVYAGRDGSIEARYAATGQLLWQRKVEGRVTSVNFDTGWLIASTESGPLLAMRAADGEVLWQRDLGSPLSAPPALSGDSLYLGLQDGRVISLALHTGEDAWTQTLAEPAAGILSVGDRVFVGGRDNQFHSLDWRDGEPDWRWKTGADILGVPVLDDRRVYFIALDNILRGHNRNNGTMLWKQVLPMRPFTGPLLSGQTLIVPGVAAELHAYSAQDGKPAGDFVVKGAESEEMLLAAPPHLTSQGLFVLVTKGGQVRGVGSSAAQPAAPSPGGPAAVPGADPAQEVPAGTTDPNAASPQEPPGPAAAGATQ